MDRLLHNAELAGELVEAFFAECDEALAALRTAIERGDMTGLRFAAHAMAGTLGNLSALVAYESARRLEALGCAGETAGAADAFARLQADIGELKPVLVAWIASGTAGALPT